MALRESSFGNCIRPLLFPFWLIWIGWGLRGWQVASFDPSASRDWIWLLDSLCFSFSSGFLGVFSGFFGEGVDFSGVFTGVMNISAKLPTRSPAIRGFLIRPHWSWIQTLTQTPGGMPGSNPGWELRMELWSEPQLEPWSDSLLDQNPASESEELRDQSWVCSVVSAPPEPIFSSDRTAFTSMISTSQEPPE